MYNSIDHRIIRDIDGVIVLAIEDIVSPDCVAAVNVADYAVVDYSSKIEVIARSKTSSHCGQIVVQT